MAVDMKYPVVKARPYNLLVVELRELKGRNAERPHLYVALTSSEIEIAFSRLLDGKGPNWLLGKVERLRQDLVPSYGGTNKRDVAEKRLERLKTALSRQGYGINGDSSVWVVYVLDIDPDIEPKILNRGSKEKVIYVGQTSTTRELRTEQHAGRLLSKSGKHIGSPKTKGRNPTLNFKLTPTKEMYTKEDAVAFETLTHKRLEGKGYRVLGDVQKDPNT
jgi:hypothetical protein